MPSTGLETAGAIELVELLQFLAGWLDADPGRLPHRCLPTSGTPHTDPAIFARTWTASPSLAPGQPVHRTPVPAGKALAQLRQVCCYQPNPARG